MSKLDTSIDSKGRQQPVHKPHARTPQDPFKRWSAVKTGVAKADTAVKPAIATERNDIGPASAGETARLSARIDQLQDEKRRLDLKNIGLESEVNELKAEVTNFGARTSRSRARSASSRRSRARIIRGSRPLETGTPVPKG